MVTTVQVGGKSYRVGCELQLAVIEELLTLDAFDSGEAGSVEIHFSERGAGGERSYAVKTVLVQRGSVRSRGGAGESGGEAGVAGGD